MERKSGTTIKETREGKNPMLLETGTSMRETQCLVRPVFSETNSVAMRSKSYLDLYRLNNFTVTTVI
jgi:hypothetical protein